MARRAMQASEGFPRSRATHSSRSAAFKRGSAAPSPANGTCMGSVAQIDRQPGDPDAAIALS